MRKKKEETLPVEQTATQSAPKRRGRPAKKTAEEGNTPVSGTVLMTISAAEEKLRKIQQEYSLAETGLEQVRKEYKNLLKKCENIKLLLASYYNLEEKGNTDKLLVPEKKTPYWYVRATFGRNFFDVYQCEWIGGISDKFRYCRGNFFLDEATAQKVCDSCNALMARI